VPWDAPEGRPFRALFLTAWTCLRYPRSFFESVSRSEERWGAVGFALLMDLFGYGLAAAWVALFHGGLAGEELLSLVLSPLRVLVSIWIGSEMMHAILRMLRGTSRPRAMTHRAVAFCYSTALLGLVPLHGLKLGLFLAAAYQIVALRTVHEAPWWKAAIAVVVTWAVLLGLVVLAAYSGQLPDAPEG